jgi:hypothetical protein
MSNYSAASGGTSGLGCSAPHRAPPLRAAIRIYCAFGATQPPARFSELLFGFANFAGSPRPLAPQLIGDFEVHFRVLLS